MEDLVNHDRFYIYGSIYLLLEGFIPQGTPEIPVETDDLPNFKCVDTRQYGQLLMVFTDEDLADKVAAYFTSIEKRNYIMARYGSLESQLDMFEPMLERGVRYVGLDFFSANSRSPPRGRVRETREFIAAIKRALGR